MKRIFTAAFLMAVTTLVSCTPDKKTEETEIAETASDDKTETTTSDSTLTDNKKELLQTIARHTKLQQEISKLAAQKATTDVVKQYARQMQQLTATKQTELQELAQTYNVTLDTTLQDDQQKYLTDLNEKQKVDFDKAYWEKVTDAQKETIKEYEDVLKDVTPADATAFGVWARTSEKELRAQYEEALKLQLALKNRT
ncbi:DUF4142 domain-containing protein [Pontibacter pudoricolor]|uniref:DUF4142 domain-containing protein n=1 Tax=Pontibacter pudoricolor TaxID=2694930 RepID=UPI001390A6D0|nr:DUF4142 domain-containing protein [Pontibacter pudoricolor]